MPVVCASSLNESAKLPNMTGSTLKGKPPMVDAKLADRMKANKSRLEVLVVIGNEMLVLKNRQAVASAHLHVQHHQIIDHGWPILTDHMNIDFHGDLRTAFNRLHRLHAIPRVNAATRGNG